MGISIRVTSETQSRNFSIWYSTSFSLSYLLNKNSHWNPPQNTTPRQLGHQDPSILSRNHFSPVSGRAIDTSSEAPTILLTSRIRVGHAKKCPKLSFTIVWSSDTAGWNAIFFLRQWVVLQRKKFCLVLELRGRTEPKSPLPWPSKSSPLPISSSVRPPLLSSVKLTTTSLSLLSSGQLTTTGHYTDESPVAPAHSRFLLQFRH